MPVLLWTLLIFHFSSQSYQEQRFQLLLNKLFAKEGMLSEVSDMSAHDNHLSIEAKKQPYELTEFMFRKYSYLFMYALLDEWNQARSVQRTSAIQDDVL